MKNAPKLFIILLFLLLQSGLAIAQPPVGPGLAECQYECESLFTDPDGGEAYQQCVADCEAANAPVDSGVLQLFLAGIALSFYVVFKKIKHKKTPM